MSRRPQMFVKSFVKCHRALEEPWLGGHQSGYVPVVLLEQGLRGLDTVGTSRPQRELHALVGHLLLERGNLRVQSLVRLCRFDCARDLSLEFGNLGILGPESRLVFGRAAAVGAARHFLHAVRLGVFVSLRERLLARVPLACRALRRLVIEITVHRWTPFVRAGPIHEK